MKVEYGDIWKYSGRAYIVIPTNLGWKKDGQNVMGRGLAKAAAIRYPELPKWYGDVCQKLQGKPMCAVWEKGTQVLIFFPVKALNPDVPWMSWKAEASLDVIEQSAKHLSTLAVGLPEDKAIALPLVGCGNGQRDAGEVRPILERHLTSDRFILVLEEKWRPRE